MYKPNQQNKNENKKKGTIKIEKRSLKSLMHT